MDRTDIKDAHDFREAIIGIVNYMAFYNKEVCTLSEPIEVEWGLKGTANYEGEKNGSSYDCGCRQNRILGGDTY